MLWGTCIAAHTLRSVELTKTLFAQLDDKSGAIASAITQLSGLFQVSRPTIYDLGRRAAEGLLRLVGGTPAKAQPPIATAERASG